MDILFINFEDQTNIKAVSVHGMLWLQTHFESKHWNSISSEQVLLTRNNAQMLSDDAKSSGLIINSVPAVSYSNY